MQKAEVVYQSQTTDQHKLHTYLSPNHEIERQKAIPSVKCETDLTPHERAWCLVKAQRCTVVPKGVVFWIAVRDGARSYLRPVRPHGTFHPAQRNVHPQLHPVAEPVAFVFPSFDSFWVSLSWGPRSRACSTVYCSACAQQGARPAVRSREIP